MEQPGLYKVHCGAQIDVADVERIAGDSGALGDAQEAMRGVQLERVDIRRGGVTAWVTATRSGAAAFAKALTGGKNIRADVEEAKAAELAAD